MSRGVAISKRHRVKFLDVALRWLDGETSLQEAQKELDGLFANGKRLNKGSVAAQIGYILKDALLLKMVSIRKNDNA